MFRKKELEDAGWIVNRCGFQDTHPPDVRWKMKNEMGENTEEYRHYSLHPDLEVINPFTNEIDHYEEIKKYHSYDPQRGMKAIWPEAEQILYNHERDRDVWYFTWFDAPDGDRTFLFCRASDLLQWTTSLKEPPNTKTPKSAMERFKRVWERLNRDSRKRLLHEYIEHKEGTSDDIKASIHGWAIRKIIEYNSFRDRRRKPDGSIQHHIV